MQSNKTEAETMWEYLRARIDVPFDLYQEKTLFGYWYTIEAYSGPFYYEKEFEEHEKDEVIRLINKAFDCA